MRSREAVGISIDNGATAAMAECRRSNFRTPPAGQSEKAPDAVTESERSGDDDGAPAISAGSNQPDF